MNVSLHWIFVLVLGAALFGGCTLPAPPATVPQTDSSQGTVPQTDNPPAPDETEATPADADPGTLPATSSLEGRWEGTLSVMGAQLDIIITFSQDADALAGTIEIPQQSPMAIPLNNIAFDAPSIRFEMLSGPQMASFDGALQDDGAIAGTFTQSGIEGAFQLQPATEPGTEATTDEATEPLPYTSEEVTFSHSTSGEEVTLAGTLTLPTGPGPHPAVILFTGSGQQNRDEESPLMPGYRPFADIADYLTRRGIAVLRYDDRGVGGSTGPLVTATTGDFADDARAAFDYLLTREEIDAAQIGLFGHSEGGMIATMLAAQNPDVAFVVLMAGPGQSGYDTILEQQRLLLEDSGVSDEVLEARQQQQTRVLDAVVSNEGWDEVEEMLLETTREALAQLPAAQQEQLGDLETYAARTVAQQMTQIQSPWYRYFVSYDPAPDLAQIEAPVLALYGGLDLQVAADANAEALTAALAEAGNNDVTVEILPGANHLFQAAESGGPDEYTTLEPVLLPGFLETIGAWLLARVDIAAE